MNFIDKLFNRQKIECPRCLGKRNVDWGDIKRLGQELKWIPGTCAYCNGKGKVRASMVSRVEAGNSYLTTDIGPEERERLFNGDAATIERAAHYDRQVADFIKQIEYLHLAGNLDAYKIADFYLIARPDPGMPGHEKKDLLEYIEKVIGKIKKG